MLVPQTVSDRARAADRQASLFDVEDAKPPAMPALKGQLLKWIGNKQKFAPQIVGYFPRSFGSYVEPFLGSGAVLATLGPAKAIAGDAFKPLIEIWQKLHDDTEGVIEWYRERHALIEAMGDKKAAYDFVLNRYNTQGPNGADLLFLSRVCYGGVVRFRTDGYMSTPCGPHTPMPVANFADRAHIWAARTRGAQFFHADFEETMKRAQAGDVVYLDPPYADSQTILYGAQRFSLERLFRAISDCKQRGVAVVLSIDGTKKSGKHNVELPIPAGLFEREVFVHLGSSMLKRFQLADQTAEEHHVTDRLLLTY